MLAEDTYLMEVDAIDLHQVTNTSLMTLEFLAAWEEQRIGRRTIKITPVILDGQIEHDVRYSNP